MNEEEYDEWKCDMAYALQSVYKISEINRILDWFDTIKEKKERHLLGDKLDTLYSIIHEVGEFNLYSSLTIRAWIYAPYILKGEK